MSRPGLPLSLSRLLWVLAVLLFVSGLATPAGAWKPNMAKYPLRIHVLASDATHKTPRMSPGDSAVCDAIDGMVSSISPNPGGPISISGLSGDPCSLHPELVTGRLLNPQDDDPVFSGEGRGDLISPPTTAQGMTFHYDNCSRVRVLNGFQSLPARWKKPGEKLEVLIPSDDIPVNGRPLPPVRCSFSVTMHDFVYLLLRNGKLIEVSKEEYWQKPALRVFLDGRPQVVQVRPEQFTVSAHPNATH
jgi:hypothetical protein